VSEKIGVLGGAFNPPHIGHLVLAEEALWRLELDEVILVPVAHAPHKEIEADPGVEARLEMTRLAAVGDERLHISMLEAEREGPSYSYKTLERLASTYPETALCFLMGTDAALGFADWEKPERVLELATLGIAMRPGVDEPAVRSALKQAGATDRSELFEMPPLGVSSRDIRDRVKAGKPIRHLVPERVLEFIEEGGLYK
jgi:nicotinate-nucleotide adenylyltransferase